ncbi:unnamed protein product [Penicillium camemberti]|uniref:Str. FM013 n=1 Tax=Penicillium camemberti (strain FM 013) TaxID=1429867 RepID=A0A0G4PL39_PENC3|nr:unnamed protein product [Penicillium camemberti]
MASYPPQSCCYQGFKHDGWPQGSLSMLNDVEVYISHPPTKSTKIGILILTDITGHRVPNAQLIADQFAMNGYFAIIPDLFYGDAVPLNKPGEFDMQKWRNGGYHPEGKNHLPSTVDPIVESCLREMRTEFNCKRIGAVGYCFGGKYVVRHLHPGKIDVGYTAHPSHIEEAELKAIQGPLAIAAAETDVIFSVEKRHVTEGILRELSLPYQINLYSGVKHGFAVRGDPAIPDVRYAKRSAFVQGVEWFNEHLDQKDLV